VKKRVLGRLHAWADKHYRNLKAPLEFEEFLERDAIHVRAA
jgi:hypothetical protein